MEGYPDVAVVFIEKIGTRGRTRTGTVLPPGDFESPASTSFATLAVPTVHAGQARDYSSAFKAVNGKGTVFLLNIGDCAEIRYPCGFYTYPNSGEQFA